ncbi:MAG: SAM-dependent methyltransferase [Planctomycetota bacterium]|jgi:cyclopropane-fatty-acyl-phospholipid synthase
MSLTIQAAERSILPDATIRWGIRRLLAKRLRRLHRLAAGRGSAISQAWLEEMSTSPIAIDTGAANDQHYEVPAEFYGLCLGEHRKYSSCLWDQGVSNLDQAEHRMLDLTSSRADLKDGQSILELGCGWGSLSLWMAKRFPNSRILAVSNSESQRAYIMDQAQRRGLGNLRVETVDLNHFHPKTSFDRVVSVEMFEHMRNWEHLLRRISRWLKPDGRLFLHFFSHRETSYPFEDVSSDDWMARHFFTGGLMPSHDLPRRLDIPFEVEDDWAESGKHYAKTSEAWLENLDAHREQALEILQNAGYPVRTEAERQVQRWRMFFLACAELFAYRNGSEWLVSHYLLRPTQEGRLG